MIASHAPLSSLRRRVSTLPRSGSTTEVGPQRPAPARGAADSRCPPRPPARRSSSAAARRVTQHVARILAAGKARARHSPAGISAGKILQAVHGDVDRSRQERLLDLAHEETLAAHQGERRACESIALRAHGDDLHRVAPARRRCADHARLGQGQRAPPGAHANHERLPRPNSSWTSSVQERPAPARDDSRSLVMGVCRILFTMALDTASMASAHLGAGLRQTGQGLVHLGLADRLQSLAQRHDGGNHLDVAQAGEELRDLALHERLPPAAPPAAARGCWRRPPT